MLAEQKINIAKTQMLLWVLKDCCIQAAWLRKNHKHFRILPWLPVLSLHGTNVLGCTYYTMQIKKLYLQIIFYNTPANSTQSSKADQSIKIIEIICIIIQWNHHMLHQLTNRNQYSAKYAHGKRQYICSSSKHWCKSTWLDVMSKNLLAHGIVNQKVSGLSE